MIAYILLAISALFLVAFFLSKRGGKPEQKVELKQVEIKQIPKTSYGRVRIYFGSQTGTAAKLAEQLADEGTEQGFTPQVIDLKDLTVSHFDSINEVSLFLLSNTGEGDPPENTVKFMKVLKGKQNLDEVKDVQWKRINFSIFGLGNTQYQHYNKTAIDADGLLEKNGGKRIYKLGLGDDNCSLEDDFSEWRKDLWQALKTFRNNNPLKQAEHGEKAARKISSEVHSFNYISKQEPIYANYKLFIKKDTDDYIWKEEDLDFKTKASLKVEMGSVKQVRELRQNTNDGSTLEIEVELPGQPQYQTAGNIALYGMNDPKIIQEITSYFHIPSGILEKPLGLTKINEEKKMKLNFVPVSLKTLLTDSIDIQGKLSKSVLKKLAKFESKNPNYFTENSLKTTKEFERLTDEKEWYYLIRLIKEFQVKLTFEDFVELSDSMAPRLFTIASHAKTQKNVIVAASIVGNGLISKFFLTKPELLRAELRKSTFTDAMQWKKVIFIAAGTGLAPFRAFIQEKIYNIKQKEEGKNVNVPIITLFFGIKHETGDFIYKDEIQRWKEEGIINRLHMAFSRDTDKKVYVQDLLKREEEELKELGHCEDTAIYICGSLPMGKSIIEVLSESFGADKVKEMEEKGRIVKELW